MRFVQLAHVLSNRSKKSLMAIKQKSISLINFSVFIFFYFLKNCSTRTIFFLSHNCLIKMVTWRQNFSKKKNHSCVFSFLLLLLLVWQGSFLQDLDFWLIFDMKKCIMHCSGIIYVFICQTFICEWNSFWFKMFVFLLYEMMWFFFKKRSYLVSRCKDIACQFFNSIRY